MVGLGWNCRCPCHRADDPVVEEPTFADMQKQQPVATNCFGGLWEGPTPSDELRFHLGEKCGFAKGLLLLFPRTCASCATWCFYFYGSHGWLVVLPSIAMDDVKGNNHSKWQCGSITIPCNMYVPSASFPSFFQPLLEFKVRHTASSGQLNRGSAFSVRKCLRRSKTKM